MSPENDLVFDPLPGRRLGIVSADQRGLDPGGYPNGFGFSKQCTEADASLRPWFAICV